MTNEISLFKTDLDKNMPGNHTMVIGIALENNGSHRI